MYIDISILIMRLRSLVDLALFFPLIFAQTSSPSANGNSGGYSSNTQPSCRCLYGESCWPSSQEFSALSANLSQPLIHPVPPASPCYPLGHPSGNCSLVQTLSTDAIWRSDQAGAYENTNFEAYYAQNGSINACYLNTTLGQPCQQGSIPPIGVDARTVEDIQAAVKFASQHNLKIVVKNTG
jgi:hypothetical protein